MNKMILEALQNGETVTIRPRGNSMRPRIVSKAKVTLAPFDPENPPQKGDVVLCRVKGNTYCHLVAATRGQGETLEWQISNNKGRVNGWTRTIYGVVTDVDNSAA